MYSCSSLVHSATDMEKSISRPITSDSSRFCSDTIFWLVINSKSTTSRHLCASASRPAHAGSSCQFAGEFCQFSIKNTAQTTIENTRKWDQIMQQTAFGLSDSKLKQQHNSLFWQVTSPAGTNVHSMLINTTEAVASHSNRCLIHLGNNPPKTCCSH